MDQPFQEEQVLRQVLSELPQLCEEEYKVSLPDLLQSVSEKDPRSILRYTRLLGVALKGPFADSFGPPSNSLTGAQRSWIWNPEKISEPEASTHWQYAVLQELRKEYNESDAHPKFSDLKEFVESEGKTEKRLARRLLKSTAKHLCGNAEAKKNIDDAIKKAQENGVNLINPTPESLIPQAGMGICGIIAASVPYGVILGPIAGGLSILILNIGLDAFCGWADDRVSELEDEEYNEAYPKE